MAPTRKSSKAKNMLYEKADLLKAIEAVKEGELTVSASARMYNIPRQTLKDKVSGKHSKTVGRQTELTAEEEQSLVYYINYMASVGQPLTIAAAKLFAWAISKRNGQQGRFDNEKGPGHTWWSGFKKRHAKEITLRKPDSLDRGRSRMANSTVMNEHFQSLKKVLVDNNILDKPQHIYNCDESGFCLDNNSGKVIVSKYAKQAYSESKGSRTHFTVHACVGANGSILPPMVIFEDSFPSGNYSALGIPSSLYGKSPNGYMDGELFLKWLEKIFIPQTSHVRPTLLIYDGHSSHITINVIDLARENQIILYCLPPHTTNILQPLDVAIFKPLKTYFTNLTAKIKLATLGQPKIVAMNKTNFTAILKESWNKLQLGTITAAFRKCGIFPYNPDAIDKARLMDFSINESILSVSSSSPSVGMQPSDLPAVPSPATPVSLVPSTSTTPASLVSPTTPVELQQPGQSSTPTNTIKNYDVISKLIPANLMDVFIFPTEDKTKKASTRVVTKSRVITSDEHRELLAKKEREVKEKEEQKEKRKAEREKKKKDKENKEIKKKAAKKVVAPSKKKQPREVLAPVPSLEQPDFNIQRLRGKKAINYEKLLHNSSASSSSDSDESEWDDADLCAVCTRKAPPLQSSGVVKWISCDDCDHWFHQRCVEYLDTESPDQLLSFVCQDCMQ